MLIEQQLDDAMSTREAEQGLSDLDTDTMLSSTPTEQELEEHLSALPPEQQEFMAAFMTPEFAQAVGILTGSEEVFSYLSSRADSNRVLLPLPREVAEQIIGQLQPEMAGQPASPEQPPVEQQPMPQGVMGSPEGQVM
jgi:hypothetical protein